MTLRAGMLLAPLLVACAAPAPAGAERPPPKKEAPRAPSAAAPAPIILGETAVGSVAGCSVAVGNLRTEEFAGEDGKRRRAPRASLTIFDCKGGGKPQDVRVAEGQRLDIGGQGFVVGAVKETPDSSGSVQLVPAAR